MPARAVQVPRPRPESARTAWVPRHRQATNRARAASSVEYVQLALWQVLAKQVALYTMGESSSLPEYDAHRLLASACFVLGVDPDDPRSDAALVQALATEGPEAVFERAVAQVEREAARTEALWKDACLSAPLLESIALKDTLESLRGFRTRYVPRFFAHEVPADIDYPLAQPVPESLQGVDYVNAYLERLLMENRFLQRFDVGRCRCLLRAVHPQYGRAGTQPVRAGRRERRGLRVGRLRRARPAAGRGRLRAHRRRACRERPACLGTEVGGRRERRLRRARR
ncbi:MAG: DUF6179 domain-containing protein [Gordonibacter pamelaeae]